MIISRFNFVEKAKYFLFRYYSMYPFADFNSLQQICNIVVDLKK